MKIPRIRHGKTMAAGGSATEERRATRSAEWSGVTNAEATALRQRRTGRRDLGGGREIVSCPAPFAHIKAVLRPPARGHW